MTNIDTETEYEALPVGWKKCPLGEIANTQLGKMLNSSKQTGLTEMPYVRNINLRWGSIDLSDIKSMDVFEEEKEKFTLLLGDVLVCEGGEPGRAAVWNSDLEMAFQNAIHRVRPFNTCSSPFLCYQFEWLTKNGRLEQFFTGVTIKHFSQQKLRKATFNVPPLLEQHQIVEILEEQLGRLDAALENVRVVKEKAAQFRRSLLHSAFNGTLTGHTPKEGTLPEGWGVCHLHKLVDILDSRRKPINAKERSERLGAVPYFGAAGQVGTIDEALFDEDLILLGEDGIQFFDADKRKAYEISGPAWVNNHAHVLRCCQTTYVQSLLVHFLNQFDYRNRVNGTTRLKLTQGAMKEIPVITPPLSEQHQIVEILEEQLGRLDTALAVAESVEARSAELRRSLLHAAFTGRLTQKWREENRSLISKGTE